MDKHKPVNIDALIEDVLTSERLEFVPPNFHRRIGECVRIASLRQRENNRFRVTILMVSLGMIAVLCTGVGVLALTHGGGIRENGFPGVFGLLDHYSTALTLSLNSIRGQHLLLSGIVLALFSIMIGLIPLRHSLYKQG